MKERTARPGTPQLNDDGSITYTVHIEKRATFGLSFGSSLFDGWAEDGTTVRGIVEFPHGRNRQSFEKTFTSGRELLFTQDPSMMDALHACKVGEDIKFVFNGHAPRRPASWGSAAQDTADEGSTYLRQHKRYERDSKLARQVREKANGTCSLCRTNFTDLFGGKGAAVIQAHHLRPVSKGVRRSHEEDLIAVCANCHQVVHALMREGKLPTETREELFASFGALG